MFRSGLPVSDSHLWRQKASRFTALSMYIKLNAFLIGKLRNFFLVLLKSRAFQNGITSSLMRQTWNLKVWGSEFGTKLVISIYKYYPWHDGRHLCRLLAKGSVLLNEALMKASFLIVYAPEIIGNFKFQNIMTRFHVVLYLTVLVTTSLFGFVHSQLPQSEGTLISGFVWLPWKWD